MDPGERPFRGRFPERLAGCRPHHQFSGRCRRGPHHDGAQGQGTGIPVCDFPLCRRGGPFSRYRQLEPAGFGRDPAGRGCGRCLSGACVQQDGCDSVRRGLCPGAALAIYRQHQYLLCGLDPGGGRPARHLCRRCAQCESGRPAAGIRGCGHPVLRDLL